VFPNNYQNNQINHYRFETNQKQTNKSSFVDSTATDATWTHEERNAQVQKKGLFSEYIRFSKAFKNTVHVVQFLPPTLCGTNDTELMRSMLDISMWKCSYIMVDPATPAP
jgi:hypothetical protein